MNNDELKPESPKSLRALGREATSVELRDALFAAANRIERLERLALATKELVRWLRAVDRAQAELADEDTP